MEASQNSGFKALLIIYCSTCVTCGVQDTFIILASSPKCSSVIRGKLDLTRAGMSPNHGDVINDLVRFEIQNDFIHVYKKIKIQSQMPLL